MPPEKNPFDDELTLEEEALIDGSQSAAEEDLDTKEDPPAAKPEAKPEGEVPPANEDPPADGDADAELAAFMEAHKGKTTEELARLAFDQQKRANAAGFAQRNSDKVLTDLRTAAKARAAAKLADLEEKKKKFAELQETDPDAAAKMLFDEKIADEQAGIAAEEDETEREVRVTEALEYAAQFIPNLPANGPKLFGLATEMGFSAEEVSGITDGRQLVTLHLANLGKTAMIAGLIDRSGKILAPMPQGDDPKQDPRLKAPAPHTTAGSGGGAPPAQTTQDQKLQDALLLSDKELDALSADELEALLGG